MQDQFLKLLPVDGMILDFGCGSGRDTKYFMDKDYKIDVIDGSEESFQEYIANIEGARIEKQWVTADVRPGRGEGKWLNLILRKLDIN